jgi:hypothetical protein
MNAWWLKLIERVPPAARGGVTWLASCALGVLLAVVLHYVFYRIGLPSKPFIYVAF